VLVDANRIFEAAYRTIGSKNPDDSIAIFPTRATEAYKPYFPIITAPPGNRLRKGDYDLLSMLVAHRHQESEVILAEVKLTHDTIPPSALRHDLNEFSGGFWLVGETSVYEELWHGSDERFSKARRDPDIAAFRARSGGWPLSMAEAFARRLIELTSELTPLLPGRPHSVGRTADCVLLPRAGSITSLANQSTPRKDKSGPSPVMTGPEHSRP
jgi:hypothetical protein